MSIQPQILPLTQISPPPAGGPLPVIPTEMPDAPC